MKITRRGFLGTTGSTAAGGLLGFLGLDLGPTIAYAGEKSALIRRSRITTTICPYCAVGCGELVMTAKEKGKLKVVEIEGDPDHPINEGVLCPKGASLYQLPNNDSRLRKVRYRAAGAAEFVEKDFAWAAREIAKRIKRTRDETFTQKNAQGQVVNRTLGMASVGSSALDNEECWLYQKLLRAMGLVYVEHQARI